MILKVFSNPNDSVILNRCSACERHYADSLGHLGVLYSLTDTIMCIDLATEILCGLERDTFLQKWEFTVCVFLWLPECLDHCLWRKHVTGFLMRFQAFTCCSIFPFHKSEFPLFQCFLCLPLYAPSTFPSLWRPAMLLAIFHSSCQLAGQEAVVAAARLGLSMCSF